MLSHSSSNFGASFSPVDELWIGDGQSSDVQMVVPFRFDPGYLPGTHDDDDHDDRGGGLFGDDDDGGDDNVGDPVIVPLPAPIWLGSLGLVAVIVLRRRLF